MDYRYLSYSSISSTIHNFTVVSPLCEFLQTNWFEACCEILLLLFVSVVWGPLQRPASKLIKVLGKESGLSAETQFQCLSLSQFQKLIYSIPDKVRGTGGDKQTQKLVYNLFHEANRDSQNVFELYDRLVKQKSINFRKYIRDDGHARAFFIVLLTSAINSKRGDLVSSLMADMQQMGIPRNLCFYASVVKLCAAGSLHQQALKMYDFMVLDNLKLDGAMYLSLMNHAIACNDLAKAHQFFSKLCEVGKPSLRTYLSILRTYQKDHRWEAAVKILNEMKGTGIALNNLVFNNVLGICISAGQVDRASELVDIWKGTPGTVDVISYNTLLKGYAQQVNFEKSEVILTCMQNDGVVPNLVSFNTVIDCAVRAMQVARKQNGCRCSCNNHQKGKEHDLSTCANFLAIAKKPWEILHRMEEIGLVPDTCTCSTLIKGMHLFGCTESEIDRVMTHLKAVGHEALHPKDSNNAHLEVLFNSMLDLCANASDLKRISELVMMMRDCKVPVTAVTFGTLIKAFGQANRLDRVREVWALMRRANVRPTAVTYGCCIDVYIRNGDIDTAVKTFEEMKPDSCMPNAVIYTSLIRGFIRSNESERALALYKEMRLRGIECSNATFNSVLDLLARRTSDPSEMARVVADMHASNIQPDVVTYSILIKANCAAGNLQNAMSLFEELKLTGLVLDHITFNILLNGLSKHKKVNHAETVFASMRELGVKPSHVTFSILVKMYGKAKMLNKAAAIMDLMEREFKLEPNLFVYTCLIQACVQNMQLKRGLDLFYSMQKKGIEPDGITYGTLIHGCVYANRFDLAMTLVKQAYKVECKEAVADCSPNLAPEKKPSPKTGTMVQLEPDVLNSLLSALNRKGKIDQAAELESLMNANTNPIKPRTQRLSMQYASSSKDTLC